jgi:beta-galactosidase
MATDTRRPRRLHDRSWTPAELLFPNAATDLLAGGEFACGGYLQLGSWEVRMLVDRP